VKLLLHICCAVCACALVERFRSQGIDVIGYFYNPNIHPSGEFRKRLRAVEVFAEQEKIDVYYDKNYGLDSFLAGVAPYARLGEPNRCARCYEMRLRKTAEKAKELKLDGFTSTLIISPQQRQDLIKQLGETIGQTVGVPFRYEAVTELYPKSKESAKKRMLYRQQYCGCIFSEAERRGVPTSVGAEKLPNGTTD